MVVQIPDWISKAAVFIGRRLWALLTTGGLLAAMWTTHNAQPNSEQPAPAPAAAPAPASLPTPATRAADAPQASGAWLETAKRPSPIVVKGQDPFSICGRDGFRAAIASGGSAVILHSDDRQLAGNRFTGWEKMVPAGATTRLFDGCEVSVGLEANSQGPLIVIREIGGGGDRT